jgi:hypothetical protein
LHHVETELVMPEARVVDAAQDAGDVLELDDA